MSVNALWMLINISALDMQCVATWRDGKENYMIGKFLKHSHHHHLFHHHHRHHHLDSDYYNHRRRRYHQHERINSHDGEDDASIQKHYNTSTLLQQRFQFHHQNQNRSTRHHKHFVHNLHNHTKHRRSYTPQPTHNHQHHQNHPHSDHQNHHYTHQNSPFSPKNIETSRHHSDNKPLQQSFGMDHANISPLQSPFYFRCFVSSLHF